MSPAPLRTSRTGRAFGPSKWNWWYDSIIDAMLANPDATLGEIAESLGVTQTWLSIVKNTDMFQEKYEHRRALMSSNIDTAIKDKVSSLALKSLDMTLQRLEGENSARIPTQTIMEIADKSLQRLGYGIQRGPSVTINNQPTTVQVGASREALEAARSRIRSEEAQKIRHDATPAELISEEDWQHQAPSPIAPPRTPEVAATFDPLGLLGDTQNEEYPEVEGVPPRDAAGGPDA